MQAGLFACAGASSRNAAPGDDSGDSMEGDSMEDDSMEKAGRRGYGIRLHQIEIKSASTARAAALGLTQPPTMLVQASIDPPPRYPPPFTMFVQPEIALLV